MEIITLTVGDLATNCYLVTDEDTKETLIIDPGDEGDFISITLLEKKLIPKAIILTHGHYDHCLAVLELKLNFNIPIYLHPKDLFLYDKAHLSAKHWSPISLVKGRNHATGGERDFFPKLPPIDKFIFDSEKISFGGSALQVIHTPGHTPGSISLYSTPVLFTGDTLFAEGVGRTDLSYSSPADLQNSLKKLKFEMSNVKSEIFIYPGHEEQGVPLHF